MTPTPPPGATIQFVIGTGDDDLRGDSSATATLNGTDGSSVVLTLKAQTDPGWGNNTMHTVSFPLANPVPAFSLNNVTITLTSHNGLFETDDNWNIQTVAVTISNANGALAPALNASGNPFVRLTGTKPSAMLPLPPVSLGPPCTPLTSGCLNVTTYHNDPQRTGWNQAEVTLTPANVNASSFGRIATVPLDEQVDVQPLFFNGQLIVATENNSLYALNFSTGKSVMTNFGTPLAMPLGCGNNGPNVGINGTPVIDPASGTLYVDVYTTSQGPITHQLHALDVASLADRPGSPKTVAAAKSLEGGGTFTFNAAYQRQRPALLLANNQVYAGYGSFCDLGGSNSRGWLLSWDKSSLAPTPSEELTDQLAASKGGFLSSIWMSGFGIAADISGTVFFTTGNSGGGSYNSIFNVSESAVRLSADLSKVLSFFTPSNVNGLDGSDMDFGSGGLMVLPDQSGQFPHLAVAAGKDGRMFVLNRDNMSGFNPIDVPTNVPIGSCWCGPSYFEAGSSSGKLARVVSSGGNSIKLWSPVTIAGSSGPIPSLSPVASADISDSVQDPGFFTSISSNRSAPGTSIIWAIGRAQGSDGHITLYAYSGTPSGSSLPLLWSDVAGFWPNMGGNANLVPTVTNGHVFVASNQQLQIFGLKPAAQSKMPVAASAQAQPQADYWGTVIGISGNQMTLQLRTGRLLAVDFTAAANNGFVQPVPAGESAEVRGKPNQAGVFQADIVLRAKERTTWGPDRDQ